MRAGNEAAFRNLSVEGGLIECNRLSATSSSWHLLPGHHGRPGIVKPESVM